MVEVDLTAIDMMAEEAARIICDQKRVIHRLECAVLALSILLAGAVWGIVVLL